MQPSTFDRHRHMNEETRKLLSGTLFRLHILNDEELDLSEMINWLNGMYDGYLYREAILGSPLLPLIGAECQRRGECGIVEGIRELVEICSGYPVEV